MTFYGWGCNSANQLRGGNSTENYRYVLQPEELQTHAGKPLMCAAGDDHTIILTEAGTLLSFGKGPALGRDKFDSSNIVAGIHATVVAVFAGSVTSYAVTSGGKAYQWGLIHR